MSRVLPQDALSLSTPNSDNAIYDFSRKAVENGLDIFRVFDSLNYIENVRTRKSLRVVLTSRHR